MRFSRLIALVVAFILLACTTLAQAAPATSAPAVASAPAPKPQPAAPPAPAAQPTPAPQAPPAPVRPDAPPLVLEITDLLASPEAVKQKDGIARVRKNLETDPNHAAVELRTSWLKMLTDSKHYEEVNELATRVIILNPADTAAIQSVLELRIRAFLAAGKPDKALIQAKALFNIAPMGDTATAMKRVAECLNAAHPDDFTATNNFRKQQQAGAAPTTRPATNAEVAGSVLGGIKVDVQEYRETINHMTDEDFSTLLGKGNLLLLSDRTHDAMGVFERAYGLATENQLQVASEAIARAMKAEDGCIGRANAWVMSIRPKH